jgi:hypothetical protein
MKKITLAIALLAALALPAGAAGKPNDKDRQAAQKECKVERGKTSATREAFKAKYHSMSRCVREKAAEEESERKQARRSAAEDCKAERATIGKQAFGDKYGTNDNNKNAHGKCVSAKAKEKKAEMDAADAQEAVATKNAAKACAAERKEMGDEAFAEEYGTKNKRNAFGRCVSRKTRDA